MLANPPYSLPDDLVTYASEKRCAIANAIMAHFAGDEKISPKEQAADDVLGQLSPLIGGALSSLWTDLNPEDNHFKLKFATP
jgi:hypothetical protein